MQSAMSAARIILSLSFLLYASWSDYKTREVSNKVWVIFAPPAFALTLTEILMDNPLNLIFYAVSFGLTAAFAIIIFYTGGFGGADAKALMCLALAIPFHPEGIPPPLSGEISPISQMLFPITVFSNSVLLAAATAIYMLLHNIFWQRKTGKRLFEGYATKSLGRKLVVLITGYKIPIEKLMEKWHLYPLEDIDENPEGEFKRKLILFPRDEERNAIVERLAKAVEAGKIQNAVWTSPGLPMLIFITIGLILALFFGDIIWLCVKSVLS
ncbi:MAG: A24 family peptidase C-terminal domain-containing protein [Candidatus Bathyarchaeia archaeon]